MRGLLTGLLLWALFSGTWAAGEVPERLPVHFSLDRVTIDGNTAFTADVIRSGLSRDVTLIPALRPGRSLSSLQTELQRCVEYGYLAVGYGDVKVSSRWDDAAQKIVLSIDEGRPYSSSEIRITGGDPAIEAEIRRWLTEPYPPLDAVPMSISNRDGERRMVWVNSQGFIQGLSNAAWKEGEKANLVPAFLPLFRPIVDRALSDLGYDRPKYDVRIEKESANGTVTLVIDLQSLGRSLNIDEVVVRGQARQPEAEILKVIGLQPGDLATTAALLKAQHQLWASGCFQHARVWYESRLLPDDPVRAIVEVIEYEESPLLGEPLTELQQLGIDCALWMNQLAESEFDLTLQAEGTYPWRGQEWEYLLNLGISQKDGIVAVGEAGLPGEPRRRLGISLKEKEFQLVLPAAGICWRRSLESQISHRARIVTRGAPPGNENRGKIQYLAALGVSSAEDNLPIVVFAMAPMVAIRSMHRGLQSKTIQDGIVELTGDTWSSRLEAATGRLLEVRTDDDDDVGPDERLTIRIGTERGYVSNLRRETFESASVTIEGHDSLVLEGLRFLAAAIDSGTIPAAIEPERLQAAIHLLEVVAASNDPRPASAPSELEKKSFLIPHYDSPSGTAVPTLFTIMLTILDGVIPQNSEFWTMIRESGALMATRDSEAARAIVAIAKDHHVGPITRLAAALLFENSIPQLSQVMAQSGLLVFDDQHFQSDLESLSDPRGRLGEFAISLGRGLREIETDEAAALLGIPLQDAQALLGNENLTDAQVAHHACVALWQSGLRGWVKEQLVRLSGGEIPEKAKRVQRAMREKFAPVR